MVFVNRSCVDGSVNIRYFLEHNHEDDLQHTTLSSRDRDIIKAKVQMGLPVARIVRDSREQRTCPLRRIHLLDHQDVANITAVPKLSDAASVDLQVKAIRGANKQILIPL